MKDLLDSFWRASAYCLHPRVILLSFAPLLVAVSLTFALGWFYWEAAVDGMRATLDHWTLMSALFEWLEGMGATGFRAVIAPLVVVALVVPVVVVLSLLLVALFMTPALVSLVATRRFPRLERRHGTGFWQTALWSLGCTLVALVALAASIPLWFIPPLVLVVPPLIWGWLTWKVMTFDVLADHATADERRALMREHRWPLLGIGLVTGYLGAAPTLVWAFSALTVALAPVLLPISIWLYTLVFAFSSLWFAHYGLAALERCRVKSAALEVLTPVEAVDHPSLMPPVV